MKERWVRGRDHIHRKSAREKEVQREKEIDDSVAVPFRFVRYRQEY